jgi:hypothetical protein
MATSAQNGGCEDTYTFNMVLKFGDNGIVQLLGYCLLQNPEKCDISETGSVSVFM